MRGPPRFTLQWLWHNWRVSIILLLNPWSAIAAILLIVSLVASNVAKNPVAITTLDALSAIFAAIYGGVLSFLVTQQMEESKFEIRARSAIRSLGLLASGIDQIRIQAKQMNQELDGGDNDASSVKIGLEQIKNSCIHLVEQSKAAISNWIDIVEDPNFRDEMETQASAAMGLYRELEHMEKLMAEQQKLMEEKERQRGEELEETRKRLQETTKKLDDTKLKAKEYANKLSLRTSESPFLLTHGDLSGLSMPWLTRNLDADLEDALKRLKNLQKGEGKKPKKQTDGSENGVDG